MNNYHIDELHSFINNLKCKPNIIDISEYILIKNKPPQTIIYQIFVFNSLRQSLEKEAR